MNTLSSLLPEISLGYYVPALPFFHAVLALDFGSGNRCDQPDSIHGCRIDAATYPDGGPKKFRRILSYVSHNGSNCDTWKRDDEGYDIGIQSGEAYSVWQQLGYGIVCTSSLKEALFLKNVCDLKGVVFVDEIYLERCVDNLAYRKDVWTSSNNFSAGTDIADTCTNSFYRCQRLCKLIEEFQQLFYEHFSTEEIEQNRTAFEKLKSIDALFL